MKVNLFEQALNKDESFEFAMGLNEYFIRDREYDEHWVLKSWLDFIVPFVCVVDYERAQNSINALFDCLLQGFNNGERQHEVLLKILYHVYVFYYLRGEARVNVNFVIDAEPEIISLINSYRTKRMESQPNLRDIDTAIIQIKKKGGFSSLSLV